LSKRTKFLKATGGNDWKTLEQLVADLDRAGYWKGEPKKNPLEKRRHVRKMFATLVFQEATPSKEASKGSSAGARHVFVSAIKANDSGELVRVYKQFFKLTSEELQDILEDKVAGQAYRMERVAQGRGLAKARLEEDEEADTLLLEELAEKTMERAWPSVDPTGRRQIVLAALIQHRRSEEALHAVLDWCRAEGLDIEKLIDEYLDLAGVSGVVDPQEASEVARSATEYFKVVDELGGLSFKKICQKALVGARASAIIEFSEREGMDPKEVEALFGGELGEYADEFRSVLETYRRDYFGWTLDEHLQFALERRDEQG
jgi:hypothetical protein